MADKPCCWLERCAGLAPEHTSNCSWGCVSGQSGRKDDPSQCKQCTSTQCTRCEGPPPPPPPECANLTTKASCMSWSCTWDVASGHCHSSAPPPPPPPVITPGFECELRALILRWAKTIQPARADNMSALFDALRLGESRDGMLACNLSSPRHFRPIELGHSLPPTSPSSAAASADPAVLPSLDSSQMGHQKGTDAIMGEQ